SSTKPCSHLHRRPSRSLARRRSRKVALPGRVSAVTLSCRDLGRMAAFYRQFGWPEAPTSVPEHVVFQCSNGVVLGLFSEPDFEARFGSAGETQGGVALTIHVEDEQAVDHAH